MVLIFIMNNKKNICPMCGNKEFPTGIHKGREICYCGYWRVKIKNINNRPSFCANEPKIGNKDSIKLMNSKK